MSKNHSINFDPKISKAVGVFFPSSSSHLTMIHDDEGAAIKRSPAKGFLHTYIQKSITLSVMYRRRGVLLMNFRRYYLLWCIATEFAQFGAWSSSLTRSITSRVSWDTMNNGPLMTSKVPYSTLQMADINESKGRKYQHIITYREMVALVLSI